MERTSTGRIALTGGIACGKSLVTRFLSEMGVETLDADDIVHEILPDPAERRRLAREVFADAAARKDLEAKLHPIVRARLETWLSEPHGRPRVAVVPLLFETGWDADFDFICCVTSARETQIARMTETRGYTRSEAESRIAAQMPVDEKASRSDCVIRNDGTPDDLRRKVADLVRKIVTFSGRISPRGDRRENA